MFPKPLDFETGDYLAVCVLPDGKLLITLTSDGWNSRADMLAMRYSGAFYELFADFACNGYEVTDDIESWEQMSNASGFSNAVFILDDGSIDVRHFWYYNEYAIKNEIEELYQKGYLIWDYFNCEER